MTNDESQKQTPDSGDRALEVAGHLLNRLIGLVSIIVALGFILVVGLAGAYLYFILNPSGFSGAPAAAQQTESLLLSVWQGVTPIAGHALQVVAPVVLILGALIAAVYLKARGAAPFDLSRITSDLPSLLAILIIITICLLPLSGLEVPGVLNNIALVVVGFYFGKRDAPGGA